MSINSVSDLTPHEILISEKFKKVDKRVVTPEQFELNVVKDLTVRALLKGKSLPNDIKIYPTGGFNQTVLNFTPFNFGFFLERACRGTGLTAYLSCDAFPLNHEFLVDGHYKWMALPSVKDSDTIILKKLRDESKVLDIFTVEYGFSAELTSKRKDFDFTEVKDPKQSQLLICGMFPYQFFNHTAMDQKGTRITNLLGAALDRIKDCGAHTVEVTLYPARVKEISEKDIFFVVLKNNEGHLDEFLMRPQWKVFKGNCEHISDFVIR